MSRAARRFQYATKPAATTPQYTVPEELAIWGSSSAHGDGGGGISLSSELQTRFGVPCYNGGLGGQWSTHIGARQGGRPALLTVSGETIPASGAVNVTTPTMNMVTFNAVAGALVGVSGTLASSGDLSTYVFTRSGSGSVVNVPANSVFTPTIGSQRRANGTIIWAGKNDITSGGSLAVVAEVITAMVDYLSPGTRYVVLGHFADNYMVPGNGNRTRMNTENSRLAATYGSLYVDVNSYLSSPQVWIDSGVTPTATDATDQANGVIPTSLRYNGGHLNGAGYTAVAKKVGDIIEAQGWF